MSHNIAPPYTLTDEIVNLVSRITELITTMSIGERMTSNPRLRRDSHIKTIHASLAIENNSLSLEQVTDIFNGKRILGAPNEIHEVKNAFEAYEKLLELDPFSPEDMKSAHEILMKDLTNEAGRFRSGGVGIFAGDRLVHMAPPANLVPELMGNLLEWIRDETIHPLIKSCVFHYEFEFIHPFADGNGRMGRMWQTLILHHWKPLFGWLPVETLIKDRQEQYYQVLGECDRKADSSKFITFILQAIVDVLSEIEGIEQVAVQVTEQVERLLGVFNNEELSAKELMDRVGLKHRPTFRDNYLLPALAHGLIEMTIPDKPNSSKQRYRKIVEFGTDDTIM